jgi:hypothetical protein
MFQDYPGVPPLLPTPQRSSHRRTHKVLPRPLQPWPTPVRGYHSRLKHFRKPTPISASEIQDPRSSTSPTFCPTRLMLSVLFARQRFRFALRASRGGVIGSQRLHSESFEECREPAQRRNLFRPLRDEKGRALALARGLTKGSSVTYVAEG